MYKFIKWLGITILAIIIVFFIAVVILANTINPNRFKPLITQQVYNATGRTLTINGDIHWSFFPSVGLNIDQATLSNSDGFGSTPFATVKHLGIGIKVLPLLAKNVSTSDITIDGLNINLMLNAANQNNWTFNQKNTPSNTQASATQTKSTDTSSNAAYNFTFNIPRIDIKNSSLIWSDTSSGQKTEIKNIQLNVKNISFNNAFSTSFSCLINGKNPVLYGQFNLDGKTTLNVNNNSFDLLRNIKFDGKAVISKFKANTFNIQTINAPISINNGIITLSPITGSLYQGKLNGDFQANMQQPKANINLQAQLSNISVQTLIADMSGQKQYSGTLNMQTKLSATGFDTFLNTLNGNASLNIKNGELTGFDLAYLIQSGRALLAGKPTPQQKGANETDFGDLSATAQIRNGIATTNDLHITSQVYDVKGSGTTNLVTQQLNYEIDADLAGDASLDSPIPITITGKLSSPSVGLDMGKLLKNTVKHQINQQLNNVLDKFKSQLLQ